MRAWIRRTLKRRPLSKGERRFQTGLAYIYGMTGLICVGFAASVAFGYAHVTDPKMFLLGAMAGAGLCLFVCQGCLASLSYDKLWKEKMELEREREEAA